MRLSRRFAFAIAGSGHFCWLVAAARSIRPRPPLRTPQAGTRGCRCQVPRRLQPGDLPRLQLPHAHAGCARAQATARRSPTWCAGATPEAERKGIARAVAWFDKRVGKQTGTTRAKAYARGLAGDTRSSTASTGPTNTTSLFVRSGAMGASEAPRGRYAGIPPLRPDHRRPAFDGRADRAERPQAVGGRLLDPQLRRAAGRDADRNLAGDERPRGLLTGS